MNCFTKALTVTGRYASEPERQTFRTRMQGGTSSTAMVQTDFSELERRTLAFMMSKETIFEFKPYDSRLSLYQTYKGKPR